MKRQLEDYDDDIFNELDLVRMRKFDPNPNPASDTDHFLDQITRHSDCPEASTSGSLQHSSDPDRIHFFFRMISNGKTLVLHGKPEDKVEVILEKIQSVTGIPMIEQRLIYQGRQLQSEYSLAECMIKNDHGLHLVGRMRSTEHPQVWQLVDTLVSTIYRLLKGEREFIRKPVEAVLIVYLDMTAKREIRVNTLVYHWLVGEAKAPLQPRPAPSE